MAIAIMWPTRRPSAVRPANSPHAARRGVSAPGSLARTRVGILAFGTGVLAILGVVAWIVASSAFGLSAFVFTTSAMSPAIPIGSLAIVQNVDAASVAVGDVVTVPRSASAPPVTQRVVAAETLASGSTALTIRGDAYTGAGTSYGVDTVDRVVATVPHVGQWLMTMLRPIVLAPFTALIIVVSMWFLWPETPRASSRHRASHAATGS